MLWRLLVGLLVLAGPPGLARAQTSAELEEARSAFEAGQRAYQAGRFEDAVAHFERSYALTHEPDLLYNIATSQDRLRDDRSARDSYRRYLAARPQSPDRANIEARIAALERALQRTDGASGGGEQTEDGEMRGDLPREAPSATPEDASAPAEDTVNVGAWVLLGTGALAALAGGALLGASQADIDAVANGMVWSDIEAAYDRVPVLSGVGFASLGVGAALLVGGLVWLALGNGERAVAIGPGTVRGRF